MVSVDKPEDNKAFAEQEQANFPMLSDPGMKVAEAYGVLPPVNPAGPTRRGTPGDGCSSSAATARSCTSRRPATR